MSLESVNVDVMEPPLDDGDLPTVAEAAADDHQASVTAEQLPQEDEVPSTKEEPQREASPTRSIGEESNTDWYYMPDSVLLSIFQYLNPRELLTAGEVCRSWNRVSQDEMLWKALFYRTYKVDASVGIMPGKRGVPHTYILGCSFFFRL